MAPVGIDPPAEGDGLADVRFVEFVAGVRTHGALSVRVREMRMDDTRRRTEKAPFTGALWWY